MIRKGYEGIVVGLGMLVVGFAAIAILKVALG
jgi:hypothetical protein